MLYDFMGECPEGDFEIPLGKAEIVHSGKDVTLLCWSYMRYIVLEAAERLAAFGIYAEVIDLCSLSPLDKDTILDSVRKTHRAVIVHEAVKTSGFGGELSALIMEEAFDDLDAPALRVAAPDTPIPFNEHLESAFVPDAEQVVQAVKSLF
jgi:pyruvate dehydrogenase E1 component beta subunit